MSPESFHVRRLRAEARERFLAFVLAYMAFAFIVAALLESPH